MLLALKGKGWPHVPPMSLSSDGKSSEPFQYPGRGPPEGRYAALVHESVSHSAAPFPATARPPTSHYDVDIR